jgi:hypothetical protein
MLRWRRWRQHVGAAPLAGSAARHRLHSSFLPHAASFACSVHSLPPLAWARRGSNLAKETNIGENQSAKANASEMKQSASAAKAALSISFNENIIEAKKPESLASRNLRKSGK